VRLSGRALRQRRIGWGCALAACALVASPQAAAGAAGTVFGGTTAQDFPVVIETSKNGRKIVDATIAIHLTCTSGGTVTLPDGYRGLPVSKSRKFGASFGPMTSRNDDGTTTDFEGAISGSFNKARTKASGKWSFKATEHDAAGAVTDTCDSGSVSWTAKQ
jgi:hypothetical protein